MPVANNRLLTDDTGLALVDAIERIAPLQIAPLVVSIPTGQWSGSGNDYYISVSASNVTANSILVPNYDSESAAYLKGPVWCVPAAGSFTIHTSVVPSGAVNIMVQFPGTMGEANYQVLADVYSKSQTYSKTEAVAKADVVNNLTSTATDKPGSANMLKTLNDLIKNAQSITVQGGGNFGITITRLGYIRIVDIYNGSGLQTPISVQLDTKDTPVSYVNVGAWLPISDSAYGSRFLAINQSGILSTSGDVYRGGWNFVYVASSPA